MRRQLLKDSGWLAAGSALGRATIAVSSIFTARWLGKEPFGLVSIAQSTVLMFGGFLGVGFGMAATKLLAEQRASGDRQVGKGIAVLGYCNLLLAGLAAIGLLLARNLMSQSIVGSDELSGLLVPGAFLLVGTAVNFFQVGLLSGLGEFRATAAANGWSCLVTLPATLWGVWAGGAYGTMVGSAVGMAVSYVIFRKKINAACRNQQIDLAVGQVKEHLPMLWHVALPNVFLSSINAPIDWICLTILAMGEAGPSEVAIFSACNQWCLLLRFLPMTVASALLPAVAQANSQSDQSTRQLVGFGLLLNGGLGAVLAIVFAIASPWILSSYGAEFEQSEGVLLLLLCAGVAIAVQLAADRVLTGLDRVWSVFWMNALRGVIYVGMAAALVVYGALGLAVARCVTSLAHAAVATAMALWSARGFRQEVVPLVTKPALESVARSKEPLAA